MAKFQLEKAVESSYSFAFFRFFTVLGIAWFPTVVFVALLGLIASILWPEVQSMQGLLAHPWGAGGNFHLSEDEMERIAHLVLNAGRFVGLIGLVALVLRAMVLVGVLEAALGKREFTFFYFSLGAPVWRMIGAVILAIIVSVVVAFLTALAVLAISWAATHYVSQAASVVTVLAWIVAACWMIYFMVRFFYFLPPVVVAEGRIGLGRAWSLGSGNFWRVFALWLATFLPAVIVAGILSSALFGMQESEMLKAVLHSASPADAGHIVVSQYGVLLVALILYEIAYFTLMLGLGLGAMANAYMGAVASEAQ